MVDPEPASNFLLLGRLRRRREAREGRECSIDFAYGMERDFNVWLASLGAAAPVKTLAELRKWNVDHQKAGAIKYGQSLLDFSDEMDLETDPPRYEADRAKDICAHRDARHRRGDAGEQLDALLFPGPAAPASRRGRDIPP